MHASDLANVTFTPTKWREGYDQTEVDAFLVEVGNSLSSWEHGIPGRLTGPDIVNKRFQPTKFRAGYDQDQVDNYLDEVVRTLQVFEQR
jgi:DivIVA domain-containing protein